jgi:hypothetical protein
MLKRNIILTITLALKQVYMKSRSGIITVILSAVLFTILFYKQPQGLNLLIFELIYFCWLIAARQISFRNRNTVTAAAGFLITAFFTVFTYSAFTYIMNYLALLILVGMLIYPIAKSFINTFTLSLFNLFNSQLRFISEFSNTGSSEKQTGRKLRRSLIFIIPIIIILIFITLYRSSNPVFDKLIVNIVNPVADAIDYIFRNIDFRIAGTFIFGLLFSNFLILRTGNKFLINKDTIASDELSRIKSGRSRTSNTIGLKNEYKAGIFLLIALNAILLIVNVIDIYWVWFNFTWNGQYLKQFVHQGTYMLILSIFISIAIVLYFFHQNLNFYSKNSFLKYLSYVWLAQNAILAVSVGVRNFWYIYYYALAYKRIGVIIFLILTLYGLYSVYIKVRNRRTTFYLFRTNAYAIYILLVISSVINWDTLIARYNFGNAGRSYLHFDFVADLSDKTLPYLDKPLTELKQIEAVKNKNFPNEVASFMKPDEYFVIIEKRKAKFKSEWEKKSLLSWNYPEHKAYKMLFEK